GGSREEWPIRRPLDKTPAGHATLRPMDTDASPLSLYLGLGDSISIDDYAGGSGCGAISLLARNRDDRFPEFAGRDLASHFPGVRVEARAQDGATTRGVLEEQIFRLPLVPEGRTLVTLTAGGNDLLMLLQMRGTLLDEDGEGVVRRLRSGVATIRNRFPDSLVILSTIYDPTDGVGDLLTPGQPLIRGLDVLARVNDGIRGIAEGDPGVVVADLHRHFLGHGSHHAEEANPYYHPEDPTGWLVQAIEPNERGASEVRRCWWQCLVEAGWVPE
ncbi:MAG: SGNH/GDSL hydrolase family protein, partial [Nitrospirae bacterium]